MIPVSTWTRYAAYTIPQKTLFLILATARLGTPAFAKVSSGPASTGPARRRVFVSRRGHDRDDVLRRHGRLRGALYDGGEGEGFEWG